MRYIDVDDQYVSNILNANKSFKSKSSLNESEFVVEEQHDEADELHACPLCESELDEPISEESMQECVDYIAAVLNEASTLAEEYEEEDYDEELYESEDEEEEDEEDDEDGE